MKKNTKTCVRLLYNLRWQTWRDKMLIEMRERLNVTVSKITPKQIRAKDKHYRREPNTFYIGNINGESTTWVEVSTFGKE